MTKSTATAENILQPEDVLLWLTFDNLHLRDLPHIRKTISNSLITLENITNDLTDSLLLTTTEILSNLIQHTTDPQQYIGLALYIASSEHDRKIVLDISNNGDGFQDFDAKCNLSSRKLQEFCIDDEGGRGLGLIQVMVDEMTYQNAEQSTDGRHHLLVFKTLSSQDNAEENKKKGRKKLVPINKQQQKKHTIFLVDDDPVLRKLIRQILDPHYIVKDFDNGFAVLDAFEEERPDLILSDLVMPEMNGVELRETLSQKEFGDITPFIFLSAHKREAHKSYINRLGIDGFLTKSVKEHVLLSTLERTLSRSRQLQNNIKGHVDKAITTVLNPSLPSHFHGWRCAVKNDIAQAGGGDFLLHQNFDDGALIILADVMGHGLPAKFFSYAYVGYLRSLIRLHTKDTTAPGQIMNLLSNTVVNDPFLDNCIFTCQVAWLGHNGDLQIASAGHPWPIFSSTDGTEFIEISGPLPGLMNDALYSTATYKLAPGEKVILYTDGLTENISIARDHKELQTELLGITSTCLKYKTTEQALDQIWRLQMKQFEMPKRDDTTIVVLEYTEKDEGEKK